MKKLFILLLFLYSASVKAEENKLKAAIILGLTGSATNDATAIRKGLELARDQLQQNGWQLDLLWEDDQTNSQKTVAAVQLALAKGYKFFIGPTWSFQVKAIMKIIETAGAVAIVPAGSSEIDGGAARGLFHLFPSRNRQVEPLTKWFKNQKFSSACILTPQGDWGEIHQTVYQKAINEGGGMTKFDEKFDYGIEKSILKTLFVSRIKPSGCSVLFVTGDPADIANMIHARDELHSDITILSTNHVRGAIALNLLNKKQIKNVFVSSLAISPTFSKLYYEKYKEVPQLCSDRGYDALMLLAKVISQTDGSTSAVIESLSKNFDYDGLSGRIRFDQAGDVIDGEYDILPATE